jgi:hypothetical protein
MNRLEKKRIVFARIPDLNASHSGRDVEGEKNEGWGPLGSRLINQSLSFKLLAGGTILLLGVAILPNLFPKKAATTNPPATAKVTPPTQIHPSGGSGEGVSPWRATTASVASKPPTLLRASPAERTPAPVAVLPPPPEDQNKPIPSAADDAPKMSVWPNAVQPVSDQAPMVPEESRAGLNPPIGNRQPEYQADQRAVSRPIEAGTTPNNEIAP